MKTSIVGRAQRMKKIRVAIHNLRAWTIDNHKTVDDKPYGGGVGMVMKIEPLYKAVRALRPDKKTRVILLSAKGKLFTQRHAKRLTRYSRIVLLCGHYEGVDERVAKYIADEELCIGEYVLTGGELPALVVVDAVTRLLPGVLGKDESTREESFSIAGVREYPQYTRPEIFKLSGKSRRVPKVLLSGNHAKISAWRHSHMKPRSEFSTALCAKRYITRRDI